MREHMTQKTLIDDAVLDSMLSQTQFGPQDTEEEFWFSRNKQKQYIFELGAKYMELEDMTPREAVTMAKDYVDTFYNMVLNSNTWKK